MRHSREAGIFRRKCNAMACIYSILNTFWAPQNNSLH